MTLISSFLSALFLLSAAIAWAENPNPEVCIGFNPSTKSWKPLQAIIEISGEVSCPPGYAIMSHNYVSSGGHTDVQRMSLEGACCPLPRGVLNERHKYVREQCPESFVVTGARITPSGDKRSSRGWLELRCTEIDTQRYTLSAASPGWTIGFAGEAIAELLLLAAGSPSHRTSRSSVPASIRYGLLRTGFSSWDEGGCIGYPWGSVLVGRTSNKCPLMSFKQVLLKDGLGGSLPLEVVPSCRAITSPYDEHARCADDALEPELP